MTQPDCPPQRSARVALPWAVGWFGVADLREGETWLRALGAVAAGPAVTNAVPARCPEDADP
jgi:hypothetical protein